MAQTYYSLTTNACDAAAAAALAAGTQIAFTQLAVGDSGGAYYEPTKTQTALVGEKWRGAAVVSRDAGNPKRVIVTATIPATVGGFQVREAGVFDAYGTLMVISKQPLSDKVSPESGASKDMVLRIYVDVVDAGVVTITVDPSAQFVTTQQFSQHASNTDIHTSAAEKAETTAHIADNVRHTSAAEREAWNAKSSKSITAPVTLAAAGWVEDAANGWWTQAVSNPAIVDGRKVDISFDAAQIRQLAEDGASIMIINDGGTATAYAFGAAPTVDLAGTLIISDDNASAGNLVGAPNAMPKSGGTFTGAAVAGGTQAIGTAQVRNIIASQTDLMAGSSVLPTGQLYLVFE